MQRSYTLCRRCKAMTMIPRRPPNVPSQLRGSVRVAFLGDSLTNSAGSGFNQLEYGAWACALAAGRFMFAGTYGTGGIGSATLLSTYVPEVIAATPRPNYCVVCIGQNDLGSLTASQIVANIDAIAKRLAASRIQPVLATMPPNDSLSDTRYLVNGAITVLAARNGWPLVDLFSIADPITGRWQSGDTGDGTHPTAAGAQKMGQLVVDQLVPTLPYWAAPLTNDNKGISASQNQLHLTDTNEDGIPDGWQRISGSGSNNTNSLVSASSDAKGNWFKIAKTSTGSVLFYTVPKLAASPGDVIQWAFRWKTENLSGGARVSIGLDASSGSTAGASVVGAIASAHSLWASDAAPATFYAESVQPEGATHVHMSVNLTNGTGDLFLAQITMRNATAGGFTS